MDTVELQIRELFEDWYSQGATPCSNRDRRTEAYQLRWEGFLAAYRTMYAVRESKQGPR